MTKVTYSDEKAVDQHKKRRSQNLKLLALLILFIIALWVTAFWVRINYIKGLDG